MVSKTVMTISPIIEVTLDMVSKGKKITLHESFITFFFLCRSQF